jgi:hypothetical protein
MQVQFVNQPNQFHFQVLDNTSFPHQKQTISIEHAKKDDGSVVLSPRNVEQQQILHTPNMYSEFVYAPQPVYVQQNQDMLPTYVQQNQDMQHVYVQQNQDMQPTYVQQNQDIQPVYVQQNQDMHPTYVEIPQYFTQQPIQQLPHVSKEEIKIDGTRGLSQVVATVGDVTEEKINQLKDQIERLENQITMMVEKKIRKCCFL